MARRRYMTCERFDASLVNVPLPRYKVIMDGFWMSSLQETVASLLQGACIKQICMGADLFFPFQFDRPNSPAMGFGRIPCDMRNNSVTNDTYMGCVMAS